MGIFVAHDLFLNREETFYCLRYQAAVIISSRGALLQDVWLRSLPFYVVNSEIACKESQGSQHGQRL